MWFGWNPADFTLMALLLPVLCSSAFFSGSETAFFGLRAHDLADLRAQKKSDRLSRIALSMLAEPRLLLVTLLLGNMVTNVLYFVISSVLLLHLDVPLIVGLLVSQVFLLVIIMFGEVAPKLIATKHALGWIRTTTLPLFTIHEALRPIRVPLTLFVVEPLLRVVTSSGGPPDPLDSDELDAIIELSVDRGIINDDERRLLRDVVVLRNKKVRDVMIPRTNVVGIGSDATRDEVIAMLGDRRFAELPVYRETMDNLDGILDVRMVLLNAKAKVASCIRKANYIPELASLDHALAHFRSIKGDLAIVVDEFGQTEGIVTQGAVLRELIGDEAPSPETLEIARPPALAGIGRWALDGSMNLHDLEEAFDVEFQATRVATIGGYIIEQLGRFAEVGDVVEVTSAWRLVVSEVQEHQIVTAHLEMVE